MTTTDAHGLRCATCATALGPADRFCTTCGTPAPTPQGATPTQGWPPQGALRTEGWPPSAGAQRAVPTQGWPPASAPAADQGWPTPAARPTMVPPPKGPPPRTGPPPMGPPMGPPPFMAPPLMAPPPPRRSGGARGAVIAAIVVLAVLAVVGTVLVVRGPWWEEATPTPEVAAPSSAPTSPSRTLPAEPSAALQTQRGSDAGVAESMVGSWAPQLSAKKEGLVVDGQTYDAAAILADHLRLRGEYPDAVLVWSGDYTSFRSTDFWITIVNRPFATPEAANAWCDSAGIGPDDCYAKRLSHSGEAATHTALRPAGSGTGLRDTPVPGGATPVLGDPSWAPGVVGFGSARPVEINANGDPTSYAVGITWDSWGGAQATGRGTAGWYPPNGYASDTRMYPAVIVAYDLGECHGRLGYRSVGWYFPTQGETSLPPENGYRNICDGS
ncbi:hypothetical protein ACQPX6_25105 [Actinomycetospora sp. CA-101289]|uniref:hypothetical protein n=1 Tax=Actinomycetospora sp. CA-101289 TaxID=3239893 RepID=UPI003D9646D9